MENNCKLCSYNCKAITTLDDKGFGQLSANHAVVSFKKNESIIKQGTYSTNVAFLREGIAKIHITGPTHEQIVKVVKAPTYLGLPTTFGDKINQYSVTAISNVSICFIDVHVFKQLLEENPLFSYEIILELCRNELESFRRCANRTQKQMRGNLADVLLEFSDHIFCSDCFTLPFSQTELGNMVDTSRESISRMLAEFDKEEIIHVAGKHIEIVNKKSLQVISQNG